MLRAKHDVYVFKDGTIRYDMTDLPLTHFKPKEIGVSVEKLRELGYTTDYLGNELKSEEQIVELKPQDIVIAKSCAEYLLRVANFVDDLLVKFYRLEPYYNVEKIEDLIGHLVIALAPHTSAGVLGRIIGFVDILGCYAHPYFHAAKRRNCDGDEDCVMLLLDGLLNFSRHFLPEKRGGQMDAPLVLTTIVDPREVDKEVHNMDIVSRYPLEFYQATLRFANPKELEDTIEKVKDRLKLESRFFGLSFTHDTEIANGLKESAYKKLKTMSEKVEKQMEIARKISAVDENDVAERVITIHFLPDIIGNLRAFSRQEFRCVDCNEKYRRVPLSGKCRKCGGNLTLTVHSSSIVKYLDISKKLCEEYKVTEYTRQRLKLIEHEIKSLFFEKQVTLAELW
ncbi:MAG: DNA polymerase II large subunit [Archaeoglobaceae archaeon]